MEKRAAAASTLKAAGGGKVGGGIPRAADGAFFCLILLERHQAQPAVSTRIFLLVLLKIKEVKDGTMEESKKGKIFSFFRFAFKLLFISTFDLE